MRKLRFFVFIFALCVCAFAFTACNSSEGKYTVNYYNEGKIVKTEKVEEGKAIKGYTAKSSNGYSFIGWSYNGDFYETSKIVTSDMDLYALYSGYDVTITFKNANGNVLNKNETLYNAGDYIEYPNDPSLPTDDDYEYTFTGWDYSGKIAQEDLTITAQYDKKVRQYKVTYYSYDNETVYLTNMVEKNSLAPTASLTREKDSMYTYTFYNWYTEDGTIFDFNTPITKNTYLYPSFKVKAVAGFDFSTATVSMLGDSVSTFYSSTSSVNSYYHEHDEYYYPVYSSTVTTVEQTWWYQAIINLLGAKIGINNSLSGSCAYGGDTATESDKRINTLNENGEPNIILILVGGNDNVNGYTVSQFKSAYQTMLSRVHKRYPNAYVFCLTLGYVSYTGFNYTDERRIEYNNAIRELLDVDYASLIDWATVQTEETYASWLGDKMHYNDVGMTYLANYVNECVRKFFQDNE